MSRAEIIDWLERIYRWVELGLRKNWIGIVVLTIATAVFFWPLLQNIATYSEGGDAAFNAWTLSRDHNCILRTGCPNYVDANIYYPHKDTMLYSETQLSAGVVTLPLRLLTENPILAYNVLTILSFFLAGLFMYLLTKYISKGNEAFSILAGLVFEFAPFKIAAETHLQNLSIFCLPIAVLFVLMYIDKPKRRYLMGLFIALLYVFYASWYQMVFVLIGIGVFLAVLFLLRGMKTKTLVAIGLTTLLAIVATLPLAVEYVRFSKSNGATFSIKDQVLYSSSVSDYVTPHDGTPLGKVFYQLMPDVQRNSYNLDSFSYHGISLYVLALAVVVFIYRKRLKTKVDVQNRKLIWAFVTVGLVGIILSLGPLLKFKAGYFYPAGEGVSVGIPAPYILIDMFLPQLSFIRAIGRISVLALFALCVMLAYFVLYSQKSQLFQRYKTPITVGIFLVVAFELMPLHTFAMSKNTYAYNLQIPKVYQYIKAKPEINNLIVLRSKDYPEAQFDVARSEDVLWAGYHNRNIFNGYSGYTPPTYFSDYSDFVNFTSDDIVKMKKNSINYIIVDKKLMDNKPEALQNIESTLGSRKLYSDERYSLYSIKGY